MNRTQFMLELAALLQDISAEERTEAMKYYNDYFDEAGKENEEQIIRELGSPGKVASEIKAGLGTKTESQGEFSERGYTDPRFERKAPPAGREEDWTGRGTAQREWQEEASGFRTNRTIKILLVVLILLACAPIIIPVAIALICVAVGLVLALFGIFLGVAAASAAIAIVGIVLFVAGAMTLLPDLPVGLALLGSGMIIGVVGVILTVASVRLCMIVLPGLFRFFVDLLRKPFHRRKAVAR